MTERRKRSIFSAGRQERLKPQPKAADLYFFPAGRMAPSNAMIPSLLSGAPVRDIQMRVTRTGPTLGIAADMIGIREFGRRPSSLKFQTTWFVFPGLGLQAGNAEPITPPMVMVCGLTTLWRPGMTADRSLAAAALN